MTISEAFAAWQSEIRPAVVAQYSEDDGTALSESWNDYTDALCKDGELTALQYHHCPAYDDEMPGDWDDEREYLLRAMGVRFTYSPIAARTDRSDWTDGARHFSFTFSRGGKSYGGEYSMGAALTGNPNRQDVLHSLLMDTDNLDQDFEDWAADLGYDPDSRTAERTYNACKAALEGLQAMFTSEELDGLRELFADF